MNLNLCVTHSHIPQECDFTLNCDNVLSTDKRTLVLAGITEFLLCYYISVYTSCCVPLRLLHLKMSSAYLI